ncbi:MAG: 50S ribosomal protein L35 [Candidatus Omnitrophica bacterium]|nr:50S ribosomal protein L35 [Candidatus Omnitrophota bacterium]
MPKMKTRRSIAKRFRFTAKGGLQRAHANRRHLLSHKGRKRKRLLRRPDQVDSVDARRVIPLLPYR